MHAHAHAVDAIVESVYLLARAWLCLFWGLLPMWRETFVALYKYVQLIVGADPRSRRFRRWTSSLYGIVLVGGP